MGETNTQLPSFAQDYFNHLDTTNHSQRTSNVYKYDLNLFFAYLCEHKTGFPEFPAQITLEQMATVTHRDIEAFLGDARINHHNTPPTLAKKQSAIQSLYRYLVREDMLKANITLKLDRIKIHDKLPIVLKSEKIPAIIDHLENATGPYKLRNKAVIFTLLGTGIRVSELCGLDLEHIDFQKQSLRITRKGGNEANVYFGDDVADSLKEYLEKERPFKGHSCPAVFLSKRKDRISVDMVEIIVKQYTGLSPHKMRSTFATTLLRKTRNLALVQDALGHKDPRTTRKYTKVTDEELRAAAQEIKLK